MRSYLAVPVLSRTGKVHGGLFLGHKDVGVFTERHERLAVGVAAWAALAMDNGYLYAEAQRANAREGSVPRHAVARASHAAQRHRRLVEHAAAARGDDAPQACRRRGPRSTAIPKRSPALIEDLLDVSRIATGKLRLAETDVDLNEVVRDSVRTIEPQFDEKRVALSVDHAAAALHVRGDEARLRQVVVNLLSNAVKFTASGGQVDVRRHVRRYSAVLIVSDTGIGIHPDFCRMSSSGSARAMACLDGSRTGPGNLRSRLHGGPGRHQRQHRRGSQFTVTLPRTLEVLYPRVRVTFAP